MLPSCSQAAGSDRELARIYIEPGYRAIARAAVMETRGPSAKPMRQDSTDRNIGTVRMQLSCGSSVRIVYRVTLNPITLLLKCTPALVLAASRCTGVASHNTADPFSIQYLLQPCVCARRGLGGGGGDGDRVTHSWPGRVQYSHRPGRVAREKTRNKLRARGA